MVNFFPSNATVSFYYVSSTIQKVTCFCCDRVDTTSEQRTVLVISKQMYINLLHGLNKLYEMNKYAGIFLFN